jgi:hypothetical protein
LRFFKSVPPSNFREDVNEGQNYKICPQHQVGWFDFAKEFGTTFAASTGSIPRKWDYPITPSGNYTYPIPSFGPGSSVQGMIEVYKNSDFFLLIM